MMKKTLLSLSIAGLLAASSATASVMGGYLGNEAISSAGSVDSTAYTVANNADRVLVVALGGEAAGSNTFSGATVTWGTQSLSLVDSEFDTNYLPGTALFFLAAPDTGNLTLTVDAGSDGISGGYSVGVYSLWNAEQSAPTIFGSTYVSDNGSNVIDLGTVDADGAAISVMADRQSTATGMTFNGNAADYFDDTFSKANAGGGSIIGTTAGNLTMTGLLTSPDADDTTAQTAVYIAAIPEPSTFALVGLAFGAVVLFRRRKS